KNLVVTVSDASAGPSLTGTWTGKMKAKNFSQIAPSPKATQQVVTLAITQNGAALTATLTVGGNALPNLTGQSGNSNLWLLGNANSQGVIFSGHLSKKGDAISGAGILTTPDG